MKKCLQTILDFFANIFSLFAQWFARIFNTKQSESMKLQKYKNIDLVQINIKKGVSEYFFPQNVDWVGRKIDKLIVYGNDFFSDRITSPIDGITPIISDDLLSTSYLDLYDSNGVQIGYNISAKNIIHTCNHPIELHSTLSLQLSKIVFPEPPGYDCCMLIYVFWGSSVEEMEELPNHSVTIEFPIGYGEEIKLDSVIDTYIHSQSKKIKGMYIWSVPNRTLFFTLRDYNYRTIVKLLPGHMCRPPMGVSDDYESESAIIRSQSVQVNPMYFDCADVDFENSFVYHSDHRVNPSRQNYITITFLY